MRISNVIKAKLDHKLFALVFSFQITKPKQMSLLTLLSKGGPVNIVYTLTV